MTKTFVYAKIVVEGYHRWPAAPDKVAFLRNEHRHLFHIVGYKQVQHDDRDVEFIMLGQAMRDWFTAHFFDGRLGVLSCEGLARQFMEQFDLTACHVSEDGENGAWIVEDF